MTASKKPSLAEQLRTSMAEARKPRTKDIRIPGYEPALFVTFRPLDDFDEVYEMGQDMGERLTGPNVTGGDALEAAARTLVVASKDTYAIVDGKHVAFGFGLGVDLYEAIFGEDEPLAPGTSDTEACMLLFRTTVDLASMAAQFNRWNDGTDAEVRSDLLGN